MSTAATHIVAQADSLGMAVIAASKVPLLLLDGQLAVIASSRSFLAAFGFDADRITGSPVAALGSGEWGGDRLQRRLAAVLADGVPIAGDVIVLRPKGRPNLRFSLDAEVIEEMASGGRSLLVAIAAINGIAGVGAPTRGEQDRIEDQEVLLQELQHRTANGLQIISSLLMQGARRTASDETRGHLEAAHHRILSVAAVQNHLAMARTGEVRLRLYLTTLCRSIAASMIHDPARVSLEVVVDDSVSNADDAMSLGMIATELITNALKYAFPDGRPGKITLSYESNAIEWTLQVADNGIGMRADRPLVPTGLGTAIVDALARKLRAKVLIGFGAPGVRVSING
ncbi:sensor histidine kinase [Rhizorhabdus dicambivorans]|uniref:histidine kinase n=1 Tax=Rhizorhabdus dicambivorans TaxID=1850238 RepID=A0A2A4FX43_9SPHN|nr:PAS domain-containing sensor histidine kinase [Rhizorhabdus dicambivorans]ATE65379.1 histidine kinase [Rhizorhabdus dicambivorans]PCE42291.1 histidine kinase [Rhizorhabdus dicambivorans]